MTDPEPGTSGPDVGPLGQTFSREVRRLRELRGLSQTDLALQLRERYGLKFHQATIDRVEKAQRPCRLDEVYALAEVLGSTVDDMLADWSNADDAFRELTNIARRAQETEFRISMASSRNWRPSTATANASSPASPAAETQLTATGYKPGPRKCCNCSTPSPLAPSASCRASRRTCHPGPAVWWKR